MMSAIYQTYTFNWIFIVRAHRTNSPQVNMSPISDILSCFFNHHFTFVNYIQVENRIRISGKFLKLCIAYLNSCSLGVNSCDFSKTFEILPITLHRAVLSGSCQTRLNCKRTPLYYSLSFLHIYGKQSKKLDVPGQCSFGRQISNYFCNQCLSQLNL